MKKKNPKKNPFKKEIKIFDNSDLTLGDLVEKIKVKPNGDLEIIFYWGVEIKGVYYDMGKILQSYLRQEIRK